MLSSREAMRDPIPPRPMNPMRGNEKPDESDIVNSSEAYNPSGSTTLQPGAHAHCPISRAIVGLMWRNKHAKAFPLLVRKMPQILRDR
jgi:hypothetical protein